MHIIEFLKKSLEGRGFYPIALIIVSWSYLIILLAYLVYEIFLYIFKIRYEDEGSESVNSKRK